MYAARRIGTALAATAVLGAVSLAATVVPSDANIPLGGYSGYTPETYAAETLAQEAAHASLVSSAATVSVAGDYAEAAEGGGGSSPTCSVTTYKPRGYFDTATNYVYVDVTADVWCNFTAPEILVKVILGGYEGAREVNHLSDDVTCLGSHSCSATAHYSRKTYCEEYFRYEHYGRPYGSYKLPNGTWRTLAGEGVAGPKTQGSAYRWC